MNSEKQLTQIRESLFKDNPSVYRTFEATKDDGEMILTRIEAISERSEPVEGDCLKIGNEFKVIGHVHYCEDGKTCFQIAGGGRFYLRSKSFSHSGSYESSRTETLELTPDTRFVPAWVFHNDYRSAGNGVNFNALRRVWRIK